MTDPTPTQVRAWAGAVVAHDLPACTAALPDRPLPAADWAAVFALVRRQRLEGALAWAAADGALPVTAEQDEQARLAHRAVMALAVTLERELEGLSAHLDAAGLPFRVLKGPAAAHLDEDDPSRRAFGDLDLLFRGRDLADVARLIGDQGGRRRYAEPHPGFDARFSKGLSFAFDRNCEVDAHRTLASGAFGLAIDLDDLFEHTEGFRVGTTDLLALDRPSRFLHAAYHAVLGDIEPRLNALRDLVHTAPSSAADLHVVLDRAHRWRAEPVVAVAVATAVAAFGWTAPRRLATWTHDYRVGRREQRWLAAYVGADRSYAAQMLVGLEALPGLRDRVAYAWANALPTGRAASGPERWRRGVASFYRSVRR